MTDGIIGIAAIALGGLWAVTALVTQIWYIIALFKANWVLALISLILPLIAIIILIKHWQEVKRPFLAQLVVLIIGGAGFAGFIAFQNSTATTEDPPPAIPDVVLSEAIEPSEAALPPATEPIPPAAPPRPETPSWGTPAPVKDLAVLTIPNDWVPVTWELPHLVLGISNPSRTEFTTLHLVEKETTDSFDTFQDTTMTEVREHFIKGGEASTSTPTSITAGTLVTHSLSGRSQLSDQVDKPTAMRVSCIEGTHHYFYLVQWRNSAWEAETTEAFNLILKSLVEQEQPG